MPDVLSLTLVYGTVWGATYALLALGLTLIYGVGKVVNMAHGAFIMVSAYLFYYFVVVLALDYVVAFLLAIVCIVGLALLVYPLLIHPLRQSPMTVLTLTFGLGLVLQYVVLLPAGPMSKSVPYMVSGVTTILGVRLEMQFIIVVLGFLISWTALSLFMSRSRLGKALRAVAQDEEAAEGFGISSFLIYMLAMGIAAALAGIGSLLVSPTFALYPGMGWDPLVSVFTILILGGLGSIRGTIVAAFVLGYTRNAVSFAFPTPYSPAYGPLVALLVLILVILIRPSGIFGPKV